MFCCCRNNVVSCSSVVVDGCSSVVVVGCSSVVIVAVIVVRPSVSLFVFCLFSLCVCVAVLCLLFLLFVSHLTQCSLVGVTILCLIDSPFSLFTFCCSIPCFLCYEPGDLPQIGMYLSLQRSQHKLPSVKWEGVFREGLTVCTWSFGVECAEGSSRGLLTQILLQ